MLFAELAVPIAGAVSAVLHRADVSTFVALITRLITAPARRTVSGMLTAAGMSGAWHHSRAHRFFPTARWSLDQVGLTMFHLDGHSPRVVADHRGRARWYTTKAHPSYHDMLVKLRRMLIASQHRPDPSDEPTLEEIQTIRLACADAAW